jgi:phosphoribosylglycinamide formyltransferase-1
LIGSRLRVEFVGNAIQQLMKFAVMVSGAGTILEAILADGLSPSLVVADRPCRGLAIAEAAGIPTQLVQRPSFGPDFDRVMYAHRIVTVLQEYGIELVAMAGFMTILEKPVFDFYEGQIINTHPSLLPKFRGEHAVADTLAAGVTESGCTIHIATLELDAGPILAQGKVPVESGDTVKSLQERIKQVERVLYPATIHKLLEKASRS